VPVLQEALKARASGLVLISPAIEAEALGILSLNCKKGKVAIAPIKAPGPHANRPGIMADLAALTGATLIDEQAGLSMEGFRSRDFGRARRVVATSHDFRVIGIQGRHGEIHQRILNLRAEMESLNAQDKGKTLERLRHRMANLSGGAVVLRVGATSKGEAKIKRSLAEDAVRSVECALEEGTLPGGGSAYLACVPELEALARATDEPDEAVGVRVVAEALTAPLQQIATNAGYSGSTIAARMATHGPGHLFDALSGQIMPATAGGILDSTKVMRIALEMAASTAAMILTTDAVVLTSRLGKLERRNGRGRLQGADTEP
jgi:chaperonin GroEL